MSRRLLEVREVSVGFILMRWDFRDEGLRGRSGVCKALTVTCKAAYWELYNEKYCCSFKILELYNKMNRTKENCLSTVHYSM